MQRGRHHKGSPRPSTTALRAYAQGERQGPPFALSVAERSAAESKRGPVLLAWAKDRDGLKVHVAAIDPAARRARAPFACLACGEELVARLGRERARHFAHRPGSTCALTRPETALHLGVKERLLELCAAAFAGSLAVALGARCPRCRR